MYYRVNYRLLAGQKYLALESGTGSAPAAIGGAYTDLGTFQHTDTQGTDEAGAVGAGINHALVTHLEEFIRQSSIGDPIDPDQRVNISEYVITLDEVRTLSIGSGGISVVAGADTANIAFTVTPANADLSSLQIVSADTTKATVKTINRTTKQYVIHGVAAGTSVISASVKSKNGTTVNASPTRTATVTAP